jgi:hypothetical protein
MIRFKAIVARALRGLANRLDAAASETVTASRPPAIPTGREAVGEFSATVERIETKGHSSGYIGRQWGGHYPRPVTYNPGAGYL